MPNARQGWAVLIAMAVSDVASAADHSGSRFRRIEDDAQAKAITTAAVEAAAAQIPWMFRSIARSKLEPIAFACPGYTFRWDARQFHVHCVNAKPFTWNIGENGRWVDSEGVEHPIRFTRVGERFTLEIDGDDGSKSWIYDFTEAGQMTLTQAVTSPYLTDPMRWVLHYRSE